MNTIEKYKKEIRTMFFMSVNKDIAKWSCDTNNFYSPEFNKTKLNIDLSNDALYLYYNGQHSKILGYKSWIFITDFKIWLYVRKLIKEFKNREQDKKDSIQLIFLKSSLSNLEKQYVKEIRKEKINKIEEK